MLKISILHYLYKHLKKLNKKITTFISALFKKHVGFTQFSSTQTNFLSKEQTISLNHSKYFFNGRVPYWSNLKNIKLRRLYLKKRTNIEMLGRGIIIDQDGYVDLDSTIFQKEYFLKLKSNHLIYFRKLLPYKKINKGIVLANYLDRNYFHWTLESIGRLILIDQKELKEYTIILDLKAPKFAIDSLITLLNIKPEKIHIRKSKRIKVSKVLIPSFTHVRNKETNMLNVYHPLIIEKINTLSKKISHSLLEKQNIIISRKNAKQRNMINPELIIEKFPEYNFEIIKLENLSFIEQVQLFRNINIVIATHGAGLTNLIFSENPLVIELFPSSRLIRDAFYFYQITQALNITHFVIEYDTLNVEQNLIFNSKTIAEIKYILTNS